MKTIETERLLLRMFRDEDLDDYAVVCADDDVMRFLGDGRALERWEAWRQMSMIIGHWHLRGYGPWAVEERATGKVIGRIGFFNPEGWPGFELGWMLGKAYWGRGYATEGASAALTFAFEEMRRDRVISLIQPANEPSIKVALRLGESVQGEGTVLGKSVLIYGIDADTWNRKRSANED